MMKGFAKGHTVNLWHCWPLFSKVALISVRLISHLPITNLEKCWDTEWVHSEVWKEGGKGLNQEKGAWLGQPCERVAGNPVATWEHGVPGCSLGA